MDLALAALDERGVALDHRGHLLALVRVDQENDLVMTHVVSLWLSARGGIPPGQTAPRQPGTGAVEQGPAAAKAAASRPLCRRYGLDYHTGLRRRVRSRGRRRW